MTYQDVIDEIRVEVDDPDKTRWESDDTILKVLRRGIRRMFHIIVRYDLPFGKAKADFSTTSGTEQYAIGDGQVIDIADFGVHIGLYRTDTNKPLNFRDTDHYERISSSADKVYFWTLYDGDKVLIKGVPDDTYSLRLWYWPKITWDVRAVDTFPYPRLVDFLIDYTALRLKNIDEMNPSVDMQLMQDLESNLLSYASNLVASHGQVEGPVEDLEY